MRTNEDGSPAGAPSSTGGAGPLFFIMGGVVIAIIIVTFLIAGGADQKKTTPTPAGDRTVAVKTPRVWPDVEPWTGQINRMHGTIRQGMSEREVIRQFKPADVKHVTHTEYDGIRTLEFADYAGQGGIMNTGAGAKLIVKIDMKTGKVLWFMPPMRSGENR